MGLRGAIIWMIIAAMLGGVLLLSRAAPRHEARTSFSLGLDPASVTELRIETIADIERVRKSGPEFWIRQLGSKLATNAGEEPAWPADTSRVRAGLRLLATAEFTPRDGIAESSTAKTESPGTLVIRQRSGVETMIAFEGPGLGGRVPVTITNGGPPTRAWADRDLMQTFAPAPLGTGFRAWRSQQLVREADRIRSMSVTALDLTVGLQRAGSGWVLREPLTMPAEAPVVDAVVQALSGLQVERFLTDPAVMDPAYGLAQPAGRIVLDWPSSTPGETARSLELTLGSRTDANGGVLHALARETSSSDDNPAGSERIFGPVLITLAVPELPLSAEAYVRRTASGLAGPDLSGLTIIDTQSGVVAHSGARTVDGWALNGAPDRDSQIATLLSLLTEQPANELELLEPEVAAALPGLRLEISLTARGGVEAERFAIALPTEDAPLLRFIRAGNGIQANEPRPVWGFRGSEAAQLVDWLLTLLEV